MPEKAQDYSSIMHDSITGNPRAVDLAMLGAHDVFTAGMQKNAAINTQELPAFAAPLVRPFRRIVRRVSRAQRSDAYTLAKAGVRYFDVRAVWQAGDFHSTHGLLSGKLDGYVRGLLRFLGETDGELLIFDVQHAYLRGSSMEAFFAWLGSVREDGRSLLDYVRFDPHAVPLADLTYRQAVCGGSGVVLLANAAMHPGCKHYLREGSIRSIWHNTDNHKKLFACMQAESAALLADRSAADWNGFRVNQAVVTLQVSPASLLRMFRQTLLGAGSRLNAELVQGEAFAQWLQAMPIVMVDCADSTEGEFLPAAMRLIAKHNAGL